MRPAPSLAGAQPPAAPPISCPPRAAQPPDGLPVERCWQLRRTCCVTPRQFLLGMGFTAGIALAVSLGFALRGLWPVAVYGAAEILLLAGAALSFTRHVRDGETIMLLADGRLVVDVQSGPAVTRHVFNRNWARLVRPPDAPGSLWLHYGSFRLRLARHVPMEEHRRIEAELRHSLPWRGPATTSPPGPPLFRHRSPS